MATDYLGILGQAGSALYSEKKFGDAQDEIQGASEQARQDVTQWEQPYSDYGLESMEAARGRGDFSFSGEDFEKDPSYEFLQEEGARTVQRSSAANKMLQSGNTLAALQERGQKLASTEYQAAFDRAKDTYGINTKRDQFGMELGQQTAINIGDNLADIGIMEGASLAQMDTMQAKRMSELISSTLASRGQNVPADAINDMISKGVGTVGDFLKENLGGLATKAAGAMGFGGGAAAVAGDTMLGTAGANQALTWGIGGLEAAGAPAQAVAGQLGQQAAGDIAKEFGAEALGGSSLASTGFATWAGYAAVGIGGLFALQSIVTALRGKSKFQKVAGKLAGKTDPMGYIAGLSGDDLPRDTRHSEDNWFKMNDSSSRGALYSTIMKDMSSEDALALRGHKDFNKISKDLFNYAKSGAGKGKNAANPTKALIALYPSMAQDIKLMAAAGGAKWNKGQQSSTWEDLGGGFGPDTSYYDKAMDKGYAAEQRVRQFMRQQNRVAGGQRNAGGLTQEWQQAGYSSRREARRARRAERRRQV